MNVMLDAELLKQYLKEDVHEKSPWCAYADGKQEWKSKGNYFTNEELAEMDKLDDFEIHPLDQVVMDGN